MCSLRRVSFGDSNVNFFSDNAKRFSTVNSGFSSNNSNVSNVESDSSTKLKKQKLITYVSSTVALASLGVAGYLYSRNLANNKNVQKMFESFTKELKLHQDKTAKISSKLDDVIGNIDKKIAIVNLQNSRKHDALVRSLKELENKTPEANAVFNTRKVTVDGLVMDLGTTISEITGKVEEKMRNILRTESTKRIFGMSEKLPVLPKYSIVRVPLPNLCRLPSQVGLRLYLKTSLQILLLQ